MILEMHTKGVAIRDELRPTRIRVPTLWSALGADARRQLAATWAELIVQMRRGDREMMGGEHGRDR